MRGLQIDKLLQAEMDRKKFLQTLGFGIIAASGVVAALKSVHSSLTPSRSQSPAASSGSAAFGSSPYGGRITK